METARACMKTRARCDCKIEMVPNSHKNLDAALKPRLPQFSPPWSRQTLQPVSWGNRTCLTPGLTYNMPEDFQDRRVPRPPCRSKALCLEIRLGHPAGQKGHNPRVNVPIRKCESSTHGTSREFLDHRVVPKPCASESDGPNQLGRTNAI